MKWHTLICKEKEEREKKESGSNRPLPHRSAQQTSVLVASTTEEERDPFSLDFHSVLVHLIYICLRYRVAGEELHDLRFATVDHPTATDLVYDTWLGFIGVLSFIRRGDCECGGWSHQTTPKPKSTILLISSVIFCASNTAVSYWFYFFFFTWKNPITFYLFFFSVYFLIQLLDYKSTFVSLSLIIYR